MGEYGSMYSLSKRHINIFHDRWWGELTPKTTETSRSISDVQLITPQEKEKMEMFTNSMIEAILMWRTKSGAKKVFDIWKDSLGNQFSSNGQLKNGEIPKKWKDLLLTIEWYFFSSSHFYEVTWEKKINITSGKEQLKDAINQVLNRMTKTAGSNWTTWKPIDTPSSLEKKGSRKGAQDLSKEWEKNNKLTKAREDFKNKNKIDNYAKDLVQESIEHPWEVKQAWWELKKRRKELNALWVEWLQEYNAVLKTIEDAVDTEVFRTNTGLTEKYRTLIRDQEFTVGQKRERMKIFKDYLYDVVGIAIKTKEPQEIIGFENRAFKNLTIEEEKILEDLPVNTLYAALVATISSGKMSIDDLVGNSGAITIWEKTLDPILKKLGTEHELTKRYNAKFTQMKALASYIPKLSDWWNQIKSVFSDSTSVEKFVSEAAKGENKNGGIGYDSQGNFRFYTVEEMKDDIMQKGEVTWLCDSAWEMYIRAAKGNLTSLESIFWKDWLEALAIYIHVNKDVNFIDNSEEFLSFTKKYLPENLAEEKQQAYQVDISPEELAQIHIESNFPNLSSFLAMPGNGSLKRIEHIPKLPNWGIDGARLLTSLLEWTNKTNYPPERIKELKNKILLDLDQIRKNSREEKERAIKENSLSDWKTALNDIGIDNPLKWKKKELYIQGNIHTTILPSESAAELRKILAEQKTKLNKNPEENKQKIDRIEGILTIIKSENNEKNASITISTIGKLDWSDAQKIANSNPTERKALEQTVTAVGTAEVLNENFQKNKKELSKSISEGTLQKYHLSNDILDDDNPENLLKIQVAYKELSGKSLPVDSPEAVLYSLLEQKMTLIKAQADAWSLVVKTQREYPDFSWTFSNIEKSSHIYQKDFLDKHLRQYQYISDFTDTWKPLSEMTMDLANMNPYPTHIESLGKYYQTPEWTNLTIPIEKCGFEKTTVNSGVLHFPPEMGIKPIEGVPIKWIIPTLMQANLYAKFNLHSIVNAIPTLNTEITRKYGKKTSSFDDDFDIYEMKRNIKVITHLLDIELSWAESPDEIENKIKWKYPSPSDVNKKLKDLGVINNEGNVKKESLKALIGTFTSEV